MKKVLFLMRSPAPSGAQRVLIDTVRALDPQKYALTVQVIYGGSGLRQALPDGVRYREIVPAHRGAALFCRLLRYVLPLRRVYRRYIDDDYDVEVAFLEGECTRLLAHSTNRRATRLAFVHTDMQDNFTSNRCYRSLREHRAAYRAYDRVVCVSEHTRARFIARFGDTGNVCVAYNVCDRERVLRLSHEAAPAFVRGQGRQLVTVSNLRPEKQHEWLLTLLAQLRDEGELFTLHVVGDGAQRGEIEACVARLGLQAQVRLVGHLDNPYAYMRACDALVIASSAEGYSTVAVEARLLGLPVLSTPSGGIFEIAAQYGGVRVAPDTRDGLKNLLRAYLRGEDDQVNVENKNAADEEFLPSATMCRIEELLDEAGGSSNVDL